MSTPVAEIVNVTGGAVPVANSFWGTNVRVYSAIGATDAARFNQTIDRWIRWPGGDTGEKLNITSGIITNDDGTTYTAPQSISSFVSWCATINCQAIIQLPSEINDTLTAKYYVHYVETTLGFLPAYWEIGNEPSAWRNFNRPWSQWNATIHRNATPWQYAYVAKQYAVAIHSVDPTAKIIGLAGVGLGSSGERPWIQNVASYAGSNLAGLAVHTYPADNLGSGSSADFFNSLNTERGLTSKIPGDQSQIKSACGSCGLKLFSDELGSGTEGGVYNSLLPTMAQAVYMMAESIQALRLNLPNQDYFSYQSSGNSSWFNGSSVTNMRPVFKLYSYIFNNTTMGNTFNTSLYPAGPTSLYSVLEQNATVSSSKTLLVANTNTSTSYSLTFGSGFPTNGSVYEYIWDNTTSSPVVRPLLNLTSILPITVPGESVLELVWSLNPVETNQYPGPCQFSQPGSGTYVPISGGTVSFTTPSIAAGSGGVNAHASASTPSVHELAGQWITLDCVKPAGLFNKTGGKISVSISYLYTATVTLTATCSGGSAVAAGNSSIEAYVYGGSSGGRSGVVQSSMYSYSKFCTSNVTYIRVSGIITTGWASFGSGSWVDFHFIVWAGASAYGFPNGNGASATDAIRYTVSSISMSYHS